MQFPEHQCDQNDYSDQNWDVGDCVVFHFAHMFCAIGEKIQIQDCKAGRFFVPVAAGMASMA